MGLDRGTRACRHAEQRLCQTHLATGHAMARVPTAVHPAGRTHPGWAPCLHRGELRIGARRDRVGGQMLPIRAPSAARPLVASVAAATVAGALLTTSVLAADPDAWLLDADREQLRQPPVAEAPHAEPETITEPTPSAPAAVPDPVGVDVSYPQCGQDLPAAAGFAIVGVNGGRVYDVNPCFAPGGDHPSQLEWAGRNAELYFNTGNPGPRLSRHWPWGTDHPRECETPSIFEVDSLDCAFNYGWNAAQHAYAVALAAYAELGWVDEAAEQLPDQVTIWLDVEEANSWRRDRGRNVAALEGAVAYLESMDVRRVGFYSTPRLWDRITGGTDAFAEYPAWHAGASDRADAERRCVEDDAFTGGRLAMVQWVEDDLDHNVRCDERSDE